MHPSADVAVVATRTRREVQPLPADVPLGVVLENRWMALRLSTRVREVCAVPTLDEALLAAWAMLVPSPAGSAGRVHETEHFTDVGFILSPATFQLPPPADTPADTPAAPAAGSALGRLATLTYTRTVGERWRKNPVMSQRMETVASILGDACFVSTMLDLLIHPVTGHPVWGALALDTWWDARIAEGHTPESARFLLALIIPARTQITYDPTTQRPTLPPTRG